MNGDMNQQQQQQQLQQQQQQQWMAMQQYQQQWMAMQQYPPAAAMVMQQQMMYGQQYMPYYHQQHQQMIQIQQNASEDNRTIWIGDLQQWMDEGYLHTCFAQAGEVISVKVIRNKQTGQSERYGFIEFNTHEAAEKVLQSYNGTMMPNAEQPFRLNWSAFSSGEKRADVGAGAGSGSDLSIFVGDLASDVTDTMLRDTFSSRYPSVKGAKVVIDSNTGRSKGYGFVRFDDESERSRAMTEMNGIYCSSRAMRIGVATPKKPSPMQQYSSQAGGHASNGAATQTSQTDSDLSNTTVFVGGLDSEVTDEELRQSFSQFGNVVSVKIPAGKGCGFVQFSERSAAEDAIEKLNGTVIGAQTVRLSWGRNPANKQFRTDSGSQWSGGYYGRQNYGGYGYGASQSQDSMYGAGAAHGASSNGYGNHEQSVS
ncbi:polyadenylate-binding protein RBP47-like isoform X2 [Solanum pennellii]|uniref:Polyadenylate-binding protein RBP47-like isoform X2 n=1 Tax=Solanum pennellii TaxID=28526 RepID=A0ABM1HSP9_SOLPN|nr:polyadenylate-binding protein RBP47-like isoform X2 [Solanum pennellii]